MSFIETVDELLLYFVSEGVFEPFDVLESLYDRVFAILSALKEVDNEKFF